MLYMIMNRGTRQLKIGYTSRARIARVNEYITYNPNVILIDTYEGSPIDESNMHRLLSMLQWSNVRMPNGKISPEWFNIPKGIKKSDIKAQGFEYFATYGQE